MSDAEADQGAFPGAFLAAEIGIWRSVDGKAENRIVEESSFVCEVERLGAGSH